MPDALDRCAHGWPPLSTEQVVPAERVPARRGPRDRRMATAPIPADLADWPCGQPGNYRAGRHADQDGRRVYAARTAEAFPVRPMWNGCSTQARTCDSALSTASAQSRRALGNALMMPRLIAMFQETSQSSSSGRLSAPV